jgi:hypothetical protein
MSMASDGAEPFFTNVTPLSRPGYGRALRIRKISVIARSSRSV